MKTLKGYDETEVTKMMLSPLPPQAVKPHQSKSYLSQISPAYTRERLTKVFGLHGIGWGLNWDPLVTDRFETQTSTGKPRYHFALMQANFWFKMVGDNGEETIINIPVTGYSDNDNIGDAMAGARTSAIGAGAKELLFQLHIYKGEKPQKPTRKPKPTKQNGNGTSQTSDLFITSEDELLAAANAKTNNYFQNVYHVRNAVKKIALDIDYPPGPNEFVNWETFLGAIVEYATAP